MKLEHAMCNYKNYYYCYYYYYHYYHYNHLWLSGLCLGQPG